MTDKAKGSYQIRSGLEAIQRDVPEITYVIEQKLRKCAKVAIIGKWKAGKSFLTIQLGMVIAAGDEFIGFRTTASNVLYVNFEVSSEMFQQRIQDMHHVLGCDLTKFRYLTITDLSLDLYTTELDEILAQSIAEGFPVEVLIIDPRWKAIRRDSNQDEVLNAFCVNMDKLIKRYGLTVIIVHHEGAGTPSDKAGKGSTVFDAWLDGWFKIKPRHSNEPSIRSGVKESNVRDIDIWSRDSERESIAAVFDYPIHTVAPNLVAEKKAKTEQTKQCILELLRQKGGMPEKEVRFHVLAQGYTDYSFWRAKKELEQDGSIKVVKASGAGNRKMLSLVSHKASDSSNAGQACSKNKK
jgi:hypothetical protein